MEETLKKGVDDVEALMNDALAPVTRERMAALQNMITEELETVRGPVSELFDQRVEENPTLGYDRNRIVRPETGTEPEFRLRLTGTGMAFKNSGSG
jgi:hypothetical protein